MLTIHVKLVDSTKDTTFTLYVEGESTVNDLRQAIDKYRGFAEDYYLYKNSIANGRLDEQTYLVEYKINADSTVLCYKPRAK
jgi:hypothetical protein